MCARGLTREIEICPACQQSGGCCPDCPLAMGAINAQRFVSCPGLMSRCFVEEFGWIIHPVRRIMRACIHASRLRLIAAQVAVGGLAHPGSFRVFLSQT